MKQKLVRVWKLRSFTPHHKECTKMLIIKIKLKRKIHQISQHEENLLINQCACRVKVFLESKSKEKKAQTFDFLDWAETHICIEIHFVCENENINAKNDELSYTNRIILYQSIIEGKEMDRILPKHNEHAMEKFQIAKSFKTFVKQTKHEIVQLGGLPYECDRV